MADVNRKTQEKRESAMAGQSTGEGARAGETTMRGSSSQQAGGQAGRETTTRGSSEMQGTTGQGGQPRQATPGQQRSEEAGMDYTSAMLREAREEGDMGTGREAGGAEYRGTGRGRGMRSEYAQGLCEREQAMGERERGMSERERGMGDRERAMWERECAMTDRERSSAWGGEGGGTSPGESRTQSRTRGQSDSPESGMNR